MKMDTKRFYSIKEVAQMFDLNESTLRFWEKEFEEIAPQKNDKGTRFYLQEDIEQIRLVHNLLKKRGLTISGARQKLKHNKTETVDLEEIRTRLEKVRSELQLYLSAFDGYEKRSLQSPVANV
jgi:DNA-binding transcriptional MerR regulator